jgi:DNA mismatch repair ATPase MutS
LTTHLENVCKKLDEHNLIENFHMESKKIENERNRQIQHLYKLKKGISYVEGGLQVLSDLKFPQEIINSIKI